MKRLAAFALAVAALPALAAGVRQIAPTSHPLLPASGETGAGAGAGATTGDAAALKPRTRALPGPILVERRARIGDDGTVVLSCGDADRRDFSRQPASAGAAR
jgi:hypothetical protein